MGNFTAFCLGVGFAVLALFAYQKLNSASDSGTRPEAAACIEANMTWEPAYDRYGAFVGIRCNPSVPYIRAPDTGDGHE